VWDEGHRLIAKEDKGRVAPCPFSLALTRYGARINVMTGPIGVSLDKTPILLFAV